MMCVYLANYFCTPINVYLSSYTQNIWNISSHLFYNSSWIYNFLSSLFIIEASRSTYIFLFLAITLGRVAVPCKGESYGSVFCEILQYRQTDTKRSFYFIIRIEFWLSTCKIIPIYYRILSLNLNLYLFCPILFSCRKKW